MHLAIGILTALHRPRQDRQGPEGRGVDAGRACSTCAASSCATSSAWSASATWRSTRSSRTASSATPCRAAATPAAVASRAGWSSARAGRPTRTPTSTSPSRSRTGRRLPRPSASRSGSMTRATAPPRARQRQDLRHLRDDREVARRQDQVRGGRHPAQVRHAVRAGAVDEGDRRRPVAARERHASSRWTHKERGTYLTVGSPIKFSDIQARHQGLAAARRAHRRGSCRAGLQPGENRRTSRSQGGLIRPAL